MKRRFCSLDRDEDLEKARYSSEYEMTIKIFKRDAQISFSDRKHFKLSEHQKAIRNEKRSKIIKFSWRSARRLKHLVRNSEDTWKNIVTLTYPSEFPCDGKTTKSHLNAFLQFLRRKAIQYVWVLEFQKRGAPHYHILVSDSIPKDELSQRWYKIVNSGDVNHLKAGTSIETIRSKGLLNYYLYNYIKKLDQKTPPEEFENVGRFWGASRKIIIADIIRVVRPFRILSKSIRTVRQWYKAHLRGFGINWKRKKPDKGFTMLDGALIAPYMWDNIAFTNL